MGITSKDIELLDEIIAKFQPKTVIELGAQNLYNQPVLPAPYAHEYYEAKGLKYDCIDLSGENNCMVQDLSMPFGILKNDGSPGFKVLKPNGRGGYGEQYDLVTDFGTSEHVGKNGKHDLRSYYNCWKNKYDLCKTGSIIISVNPRTGNWPGHGFNYIDQEFYDKLADLLDIQCILQEYHPAMGNVTDGNNTICIFIKGNAPFITFEQFKTLPVYDK